MCEAHLQSNIVLLYCCPVLTRLPQVCQVSGKNSNGSRNRHRTDVVCYILIVNILQQHITVLNDSRMNKHGGMQKKMTSSYGNIDS